MVSQQHPSSTKACARTSAWQAPRQDGRILTQIHLLFPVRCMASAAGARVVATREEGKNGKLMSGLAKHGISCLELPLIEHAPGPDR